MQTRLCPSLMEGSSGRKSGTRSELDRLLPEVYETLYRIASGYLSRERSDHILETSALVHEAYLRLAGQENICWHNHDQILGLAARMMRRILVDHARCLHLAKYGGGANRVSLDRALTKPEEPVPGVTLLRECLASLAVIHPQLARIVELRYFTGLTTQEIADALDLSTATVTRRWRRARSWLLRELTRSRCCQDRTSFVQAMG